MSVNNKKDYKHTVHLPQTSFPMKADLARHEMELLKQWETEALYPSIRKKAGSKPKYILHDGPPYANGNIHIGHALNKILKDIIVKYKTMRGFDALYVPGWDCHGLPIEHQCLKEMGKRKDEVERTQFRKQARQYAQRFIDIQREEFKGLGVLGEWGKPYQTMHPQYQASIAESFLKLYEKGFIEQRLKPVPWCWDCETALADAELEYYEDKKANAIYVKFPILVQSFARKLTLPDEIKDKQLNLLIWTTTPWTLPANVGVAVHPNFYYSFLIKGKEALLIALSADGSLPLLNLATNEKISNLRFRGKEIEGLEYLHPFLDRKGKVILAEYVSLTTGTGLVHIAPGHGEEDYQFGHLRNNLEIISPVDEKGRFTKEFSLCEGMNVFKANNKIIEILQEKAAFYQHDQNYEHSYPHCWRCKKPIIFRATPQWFLKIDHQDLRKKMSEKIQKEIKFTPDWGKNRIGSMVESRPDWCLSRQRYWGVPIPMIHCKKCQAHFPADSKRVHEIFEAESADAWFMHPAKDFLESNFKCKCGSTEFKQDEDIIDVWFDSGVSHQAVLKRDPALQKDTKKSFQASLYLEGSDQHRGWFQSSLTTAVALEGDSPFEGVLTHGFVVDGEGKKMSKSAGNVVAPQGVMKEFGADILRLWVSSCDYQFDVRLSKEILKQLADAYRKIRNTFRYMLGNVHDFNAKNDKLAFEKLHPLDQWAIHKVDQLAYSLDGEYLRFNFHQIYRQIYNFCTLDLSSYYFDVLKDTLYTAAKSSFLRRSAQSALFYMLSKLVKIFAPILAFTTDEVWKSFPIEEGIASVHDSYWEVSSRAPAPSESFRMWDQIRTLRDQIMPVLERKREAGLIGSSLDAKVYLAAKHPEMDQILKQNWNELRRVFIVSQVYPLGEMRSGSEEINCSFEGIEAKILISVEKADGAKCERCWNYSVKVGSVPEHPTLCERCVEAIR